MTRLDTEVAVHVLLEEYRALYGLLHFRMSALDRRVPIAGATFTTFLGAATVMPGVTQVFLIMVMPIALIWFQRTTVNHARSLEDILRQIESLEQRLNERANEALLQFQSRHPSRGRWIGGRTGLETVLTVFVLCLIMLAGCTALLATLPGTDRVDLISYGAYCGAVVGALIHSLARLHLYRYRQQLRLS